MRLLRLRLPFTLRLVYVLHRLRLAAVVARGFLPLIVVAAVTRFARYVSPRTRVRLPQLITPRLFALRCYVDYHHAPFVPFRSFRCLFPRFSHVAPFVYFNVTLRSRFPVLPFDVYVTVRVTFC